jgi:hypothetical protein
LIVKEQRALQLECPLYLRIAEWMGWMSYMGWNFVLNELRRLGAERAVSGLDKKSLLNSFHNNDGAVQSNIKQQSPWSVLPRRVQLVGGRYFTTGRWAVKIREFILHRLELFVRGSWIENDIDAGEYGSGEVEICARGPYAGYR